MAEARSSTGRKIFVWLLSITTLVSLAPVISVVVAGLLADHFGCHVDEGSVHPCPAFGTDIGDMLYFLGVMGWLMLLTIPVLIFAMIGWIVLFVSRFWR